MNVMTSVTAPPGPARFSAGEFLRMIATGAFDDMKVELIEGELQRIPPPGNTHSRLQVVLIVELSRLLRKELVRAGTGIDLGGDTIVGCDAAVLREAFGGEGMMPAANVLLVVEVSTHDRDLMLKRRLYAAAGVPHYWVVDAERAVVHVFDRAEGGDYLGLSLVRFGEALAVPGADGAIVVE